MPVITPDSSPFSAYSYLSVDDADTYFQYRLQSDVWNNATDSDKEKAIVSSSRAIDRLNFVGIKTDSTQPNEFPRKPSTTVPDEIRIAVCENAIVLLDDFDVELERDNLLSTSKGFASVRDTYDRAIAVEHLTAGIASRAAWDYLKPFLVDPNYFKISRVN